MPAKTTLLSPQQLIEAAKAPFAAYNEKNWDKIRTLLASDISYDEVATQRKAQGIDQVLTLWQAWATALPDSKCTFDNAVASGDTAVIEVTWRGTHKGQLQTPKGPLAPTGKRIEIRACNVIQMDGEKAKSQRQYFDMVTMLQQLGVTG
ncbi:MAG TPA: ester cyclase [Gemmatimonadales bacterium]|jgi:steroid delta-isomerase-like uncharacterized protein